MTPFATVRGWQRPRRRDFAEEATTLFQIDFFRGILTRENFTVSNSQVQDVTFTRLSSSPPNVKLANVENIPLLNY